MSTQVLDHEILSSTSLCVSVGLSQPDVTSKTEKGTIRGDFVLLLSNCMFTVFRYTTDGGSREHLEKGTIRGDAVFSGKSSNIIKVDYNIF